MELFKCAQPWQGCLDEGEVVEARRDWVGFPWGVVKQLGHEISYSAAKPFRVGPYNS